MSVTRSRLAIGGVAAAVLVGGIVGVVRMGDEASSGGQADAGDVTTDQPAGSSGDAVGDPASAATGPEGTRTLEGPPTEIPAGAVVSGAREVTGQVARGGDDWSAVASYVADGSRDEVEAGVEAGAAAAGMSRRDATFSDTRKVVVYDGDDGSIMTVTLDDDDQGEIRVTAVRVSP